MKNKLLHIWQIIRKHIFSIKCMTAIVVLASALIPLVIVKGIVADRLFAKEIE